MNYSVDVSQCVQLYDPKRTNEIMNEQTQEKKDRKDQVCTHKLTHSCEDSPICRPFFFSKLLVVYSPLI